MGIFDFKEFIMPDFITVIWNLVLFIGGAATIVLAFQAAKYSGVAGLVVVLTGFLYILITRLVLELYIVFFKMHEVLVKISKKK